MSHSHPAVADLRARYDEIAATLERALAGDPARPADAADAAAVLHAEARRLDGGRWAEWLAGYSDDAVIWVPLTTAAPHPATDQSLFLDDRRRIDERVWRMCDPNAWSLQPPPRLVRAVAGVEAWPDGDGLLATSTLTVSCSRAGRSWSMLGRQVVRFGTDGLIALKVLLFPSLNDGTTDLGWLM